MVEFSRLLILSIQKSVAVLEAPSPYRGARSLCAVLSWVPEAVQHRQKVPRSRSPLP